MENSIWDALLPVVREEVDDLIRSGRRLHAVKAIREAYPGVRPRLSDAVEVMCERGGAAVLTRVSGACAPAIPAHPAPFLR